MTNVEMSFPTLSGPEQLTGDIVKDVRTRHRMGRLQFQKFCGLEGISGARITNIEKKNSWKPGDREKIWEAVRRLDKGVVPLPLDAQPGEEVRADVPPTAGPASAPVYALGDDEREEALGELVGWTPVGRVAVPTDLIQGVVTPVDALLGRPAVESAATREKPPIVLPVGVRAVTNGELRTWQRCERKWWFAWYRKLVPVYGDPASARATGDRVHRALALWYVPDGEPRTDPRDALERVIVEDWTQLVKGLGREPGQEGEWDDPRVQQLARAFHDANTLERAMVEGYVQWLAETGADAELRVLSSETPEVADLELHDAEVPNAEPAHPVWGGDWVRPLKVLSLTDVRVVRVTDNVRLFLDHKTTGSLTEPVATLPMNPQMLHYHLVEYLNTPEAEARCDGALYNMLRKVMRSPLARPPFFDRVEVRHNVHEIESYKRRLLASMREVLRAEELLNAGADPLDVVPPTPTSNCRWDCDFFPVCPMHDDGSRAEDAVAGLYRQVDPLGRYNVVREDEGGMS